MLPLPNVTPVSDLASLQTLFGLVTGGADPAIQCSPSARPYPDWSWVLQNFGLPIWGFLQVTDDAGNVAALVVAETSDGRINWLCFCDPNITDEGITAIGGSAAEYIFSTFGACFGDVQNDRTRAAILAFGPQITEDGIRLTWTA